MSAALDKVRGRDGRPTVLVLLGVFNEGHEATGPNQSMIGMARLLGDSFRFRVIAVEPDPSSDEWKDVAGIEQRSLAMGAFGAKGLRDTLRSIPHDLLVMNSIFDKHLTIPTLALRRLRLAPRTPALLAPRGEFSPGALALKPGKKTSYLRWAARLGLLRGVAIQATSEEEAERIRAGLPGAERVLIGPNVRPIPPLPRHAPRRPGEPLRIAFLGRITSIKNLDFALETLTKVRKAVRFDIFGPPEDAAYWNRCREIMARLPSHVEAKHQGIVSQADVIETMARYDLLFLPSGGENFGHAIFEALAAGTPVLTSDQTPWRGLVQLQAGWDLPLQSPDAFVQAVERCDDLTGEDPARLREGARALAERSLSPEGVGAKLAQCLEDAMARVGRLATANGRQPAGR